MSNTGRAGKERNFQQVQNSAVYRAGDFFEVKEAALMLRMTHQGALAVLKGMEREGLIERFQEAPFRALSFRRKMPREIKQQWRTFPNSEIAEHIPEVFGRAV